MKIGRGGWDWVLVVLALGGLASCTEGTNHDTAPPSTTSEPPAPPPEPEPTPTRVPQDYIRLVRVPSILEDPNGLVPATQELSNRGWRAVEDVAWRCSWAWPSYFGMTEEEAVLFAEESMELVQRAERHFIPRFPEVNRRCDDPDWPDVGWCEVTDIRKDFYEPFGALGDPDTPRGAFWRQLDRTRDLQNRAQECAHRIRTAGGRAYDSIGGWCTAMNELGWRTEDCTS